MAFKPKTRLFEWQQRCKEGGICEKCNRAVPILTVDHIVPVSILDMFDETGNLKFDLEDNFQLLCYPCNRFKGCRLDKTNPKTRKLLLDLIY